MLYYWFYFSAHKLDRILITGLVALFDKFLVVVVLDVVM